MDQLHTRAPRTSRPISYPAAWTIDAGARLTGIATIDLDEVVLAGHETGRTEQWRVRLPSDTVSQASLRRGGAAPAVVISVAGIDIAVEILSGGWDAAFQLRDVLSPSSPAHTDRHAPAGGT